MCLLQAVLRWQHAPLAVTLHDETWRTLASTGVSTLPPPSDLSPISIGNWLKRLIELQMLDILEDFLHDFQDTSGQLPRAEEDPSRAPSATTGLERCGRGERPARRRAWLACLASTALSGGGVQTLHGACRAVPKPPPMALRSAAHPPASVPAAAATAGAWMRRRSRTRRRRKRNSRAAAAARWCALVLAWGCCPAVPAVPAWIEGPGQAGKRGMGGQARLGAAWQCAQHIPCCRQRLKTPQVRYFHPDDSLQHLFP